MFGFNQCIILVELVVNHVGSTECHCDLFAVISHYCFGGFVCKWNIFGVVFADMSNLGNCDLHKGVVMKSANAKRAFVFFESKMNLYEVVLLYVETSCPSGEG